MLSRNGQGDAAPQARPAAHRGVAGVGSASSRSASRLSPSFAISTPPTCAPIFERLKRGSDSASTWCAQRAAAAIGTRALASRPLPPSLVAAGASRATIFIRRQASALTDKDTIVLADFENKTGDPVFDDTLRQGLAVQIQQSPFLSLIFDQRVRSTLRLMNQPADARLTPDVARVVCVRTGGAAVLQGSIAALGSQYILGLRATNCATGDILADEQAQAARKEEALSTLSQMTTRFRTRVGESLATIERYSTPLELRRRRSKRCRPTAPE